MEKRVRVLIVDEQELFRQGLVALLDGHEEIEVVAECAGAVEALDQARKLRPDVVLLDLLLSKMSGLELMGLLSQECPEARLLVFTISELDTDIISAIRMGARGYVLKTANLETLVEHIGSAAKGEATFSPPALAIALRHLRNLLDGNAGTSNGQSTIVEPADDQLLTKLTRREREIMSHLPMGASNRQIADKLVISEHTVRAHLRNILYKMGFDNRVQAAAYTARLRLGEAAVTDS